MTLQWMSTQCMAIDLKKASAEQNMYFYLKTKNLEIVFRFYNTFNSLIQARKIEYKKKLFKNLSDELE